MNQAPTRPLSILHLEDNQLDADLEMALLERAGIDFRVKRVDTKNDFLKALAGESFDVILADFDLPDFNGLSALAVARERAPLTPFIFVSGMLGEQIAIDSLRKGATDYVLKKGLERLGPAVIRAISEAEERATARHIASALAETEDRFRNMADSSPVMIWNAGPDKNWEYCNRPWLQFTGLSSEASLGDQWKSRIHPDDLSRFVETYDEAFQTRRGFSIEHRLCRADGEYRWIVNQAVPRLDNQGVFLGFIGSCIDITEFKVTEERLRHAAKLESLGILAGGIAHDFNNILTGIMGNASLVLEDLPPKSFARTGVERILLASEKAALLTRQMLAYSGKGHFLLYLIDVSRQVRETLPLIEASIPRLVSLHLELAEKLPPIEADPGQIQQLVMNLVINGAEAVGQKVGSVTISTSVVEVGAQKSAAMLSGFPAAPGKYVRLRVKDTGSGMDSVTKARIFDPFFTTNFTGRGLGLAAVSGIVRGHKAGIMLITAPGQGTDFRIYFPVRETTAGAMPEPENGRATPGRGTVLVVDDEPAIVRTASLMLKKCGYTVLTAENGKAAVDLYRERGAEIDVVLLDMSMPVMSGEVAFQQIRDIRADALVVATSGFTETDAINRFGGKLGAKIDAFLQKPYRATQLAEKIHAVLSKNKASE